MPIRFLALFLLLATLPLRGEIRIEGSSTLLPLVRHAAHHFTLETGIPVTVIGGGGGKGVEAVLEGRAPIGMVSRPLEAEETAKLKAWPVACDAIALILHGESPLKNLTSAQVKGLFSGAIRNFAELGAPPMEVVPIIKERGRSTRSVFDHFFALDRISPRASRISTHVEALVLVASNPAAVGYASVAVVERAQKAGVALTVASLDGVAPTRENIASGRYPLVRKLNLVTGPAPSEEVRRFLDYMTSERAAPLRAEHRLLDPACH